MTKPQTDLAPRPADLDREGTAMLLHEALARSRQQEAVEAARRYALARPLAAGRTWSRLARFAARRAASARAAAGVAPLD
ncbi:hypothetical protein [Pseudonocardia humida]|uniref:Uncharacterized protein n=1 Tax=Pseudonocardia humida TaxID=2800819 RepID=A0ABT1ACG9_9PSEU|nr:hypothetical protein [Pseudonocardia humida]MCO1660751.1 hypothetical protein [Pseudonocardia humida]